jgi:hypothetical protein
MHSVLAILFFAVVLPLAIIPFFVQAVWQKKVGRALAAAAGIVLMGLIPLFIDSASAPDNMLSHHDGGAMITPFDIALTVFERVLPLVLLAFFVWAIPRRNKAVAVALGVLLAVMMTPFVIGYTAMVCMPASIRNTRALEDKMQTQQVIGWSTDALVKQYGQPNAVNVVGGRTIWSYSANPWYILSLDYVDVGIAGGKISGFWMDEF